MDTGVHFMKEGCASGVLIFFGFLTSRLPRSCPLAMTISYRACRLILRVRRKTPCDLKGHKALVALQGQGMAHRCRGCRYIHGQPFGGDAQGQRPERLGRPAD